MEARLLIDGYNLIFQVGLEGRNQSTDALEQSRARLIQELHANLGTETRKQTAIVFDAKDRPFKQARDHFSFEGIQIFFAVEYADADSMIEELIRKSSTPKQLTVVSSDHRIQTAATRRKAKFYDSDDWYELLMSGVFQNKDEPEVPKIVPPQDLMSSAEKRKFSQAFSMTPEEIRALQSDPRPVNESVVDANTEHEDPAPPFENPFPDGYGEDVLEE